MTDTISGTPDRTTGPEAPARPPSLSPPQLARWAWRQLTSMRVALILLFLLALAAVPGSLLPQRSLNPIKVSDYRAAHPALAPLLDRLSLFDVYSSPWFAATYLLLFLSLAGCVLPRSRQHWRAMRARPPAAPRHLSRLPVAHRWETERPPADVIASAAATLRSRRFRTRAAEGSVAAEKGYLRETGNLVFHLSLLVLLVAVAVGHLLGFKGSVLVVQGDGFSNTVTQYDSFKPGRFYSDTDLAPFSFRLQRFTARFQEGGDQQGAAREFDALVRYRRTPDAVARGYDIRVNHPLVVDGTKVFLVGHGYAPRFTVRDASGRIVYRDHQPFLPQDGNFTSTGVVKVPDAEPTQLGFSGFFLPTTVVDPQLGPRSVFPAAKNPSVFLLAWKGDLGLDSGVPQSVYQLDTGRLQRLTSDGQPFARALGVGDTMRLPDGLGSLRFDGYDRWATFQVADDPGKDLALVAAGLALAGLLTSLRVRRRRVWVRAYAGGDRRTVVELGGLARTENNALHDEVGELAARLQRRPEDPA